MQVITISVFFILLAMAATNQAGPAGPEARGTCGDGYPRWCARNMNERPDNFCDSYSDLCKKSCGLCEDSDSEPDKDDPCYCGGDRCELAPDCFRK